jgi:hypothetical protein
LPSSADTGGLDWRQKRPAPALRQQVSSSAAISGKALRMRRCKPARMARYPQRRWPTNCTPEQRAVAECAAKATRLNPIARVAAGGNQTRAVQCAGAPQRRRNSTARHGSNSMQWRLPMQQPRQSTPPSIRLAILSRALSMLDRFQQRFQSRCVNSRNRAKRASISSRESIWSRSVPKRSTANEPMTLP